MGKAVDLYRRIHVVSSTTLAYQRRCCRTGLCEKIYRHAAVWSRGTYVQDEEHQAGAHRTNQASAAMASAGPSTYHDKYDEHTHAGICGAEKTMQTWSRRPREGGDHDPAPIGAGARKAMRTTTNWVGLRRVAHCICRSGSALCRSHLAQQLSEVSNDRSGRCLGMGSDTNADNKYN